MQITIKPQAVKGVVHAPASKSMMQRACAAALLRNGTTVIHNYGQSDDDKASLEIIRQLGSDVTFIDDNRLTIHSNGRPEMRDATAIHCRESGLSLRMFTPIAALMSHEVLIEGQGSLLKRPIHFFEQIFPGLDVLVSTNNGRLPMRIQGPLKPADIHIDGSLTSQVLTGILMSFSAALHNDVTIEVSDLKSKPYIDLTLKVMEDFGMNVPDNRQYQRFVFKYRPMATVATKPLNYTIEGDWSNAAFFMVAGAIAGSVIITGLDVFTEQADKKILSALQDCGCRLSIQMESIEVSKQELKAFHFDATDCPDLFPPLVALAANCKGTTVIEGVHRLEYKESNRAKTLQQEFAKLGVEITIQDDKMIILKRQDPEERVMLDGHNDHRIIMACAVAALTAKNPVIIEGIEAVNKSYPRFFGDLESISN